MNETNEALLGALQLRRQKRTEFGYGILTADVYARTLLECVGSDACYKYAATKRTSFDDVMRKAARTLVYSNPEMVIEEKRVDDAADLPKNTLMTFRHVLTTSRKDRDGDVLHSDGAEVDPKMLLLWQHVPTLPIGKSIRVYKQSSKRLVMVSAIVDVNELCHDAAVMVDNGMARFSHGFRALEFTEIKDKDGEDEFNGFDIKRFEIMEESMVSVPSNVDANTEEILLSLVENGKLTSPLMKEQGRSIREHRSVIVPGASIKYAECDGVNKRELSCGTVADLKAVADAGLIGGRGDENQPGGGGEAAGGEAAAAGASKQADDPAGEAGKTADAEVKLYAELDGSWQWIENQLREQAKRYLIGNGIGVGEKDWVYLTATYGDHAILCAERYESGVEDEFRYYEAAWAMEKGKPVFGGEPKEVEIEVTATVAGKSMKLAKSGRVLSKANENQIRDAQGRVDEVVGMDDVSRPAKALLREASGGLGDVLSVLGDEEEKAAPGVDEAMATVLASATQKQRNKMTASLRLLGQIDKRSRITKCYHDALRRS